MIKNVQVAMPDGRVGTSCVSCGSFSIIDCFDSIPLVSFAIDRNGNVHIASLHFCVFFSQKSFQLEATDGCDHTGSQISYVESVVHLWNIKLNKKLKELPRTGFFFGYSKKTQGEKSKKTQAKNLNSSSKLELKLKTQTFGIFKMYFL